MQRLLSLLPAALVATLCGFLGAWLFAVSELGQGATRAWLVSHPEILPEMANAWQAQENGKRLAGIADAVAKPFPGAVLGNPNGKVTLVEFSDYACGYCRQSVPDVKALLAANPDARVVVREWPIFEGSDVAARMALAAARQGKYAAFHDAMYAHAPPTPASIQEAAKTAGLDLAAARAFAASKEAELELRKNQALARQLGFEGTPSWVAGTRVFSGAVGRAQLADALAAARGA